MTDYIILGIIQGIFEWFPISSQGITALASQFLTEDIHPINTALFLHLGTLFAVMLYFRKEWVRVFKLKDVAFFRFLVIATIFSGIIGFPLYFLIEDMAVGNALLAITGIGLLFTAYFHRARKIRRISFGKMGVITGILQGLSVIPGLSRSGATIFGLSLGNFKAKEVLKISYMMSAPVILGMTALLFFKNPLLIKESWPGLITSFLVSLLMLDVLLKVAARIDFFKLALIFAALCFLGAGIGMLV